MTMRSRTEIENTIKHRILQTYKRMRVEATKRLPDRCRYNHRQALDPAPKYLDVPNPGYNRVDRRRLPIVPEMGFCMFGAEHAAEWQGNLCDEPIDAQRCALFTSKTTEEQDRQALIANLQDPRWVEDNLPDVAALLWVLGQQEASYTPPWYLRWWWALFPVQLEPVVAPFDLNQVLPAGTIEAYNPPEDTGGG